MGKGNSSGVNFLNWNFPGRKNQPNRSLSFLKVSKYTEIFQKCTKLPSNPKFGRVLKCKGCEII